MANEAFEKWRQARPSKPWTAESLAEEAWAEATRPAQGGEMRLTERQRSDIRILVSTGDRSAVIEQVQHLYDFAYSEGVQAERARCAKILCPLCRLTNDNPFYKDGGWFHYTNSPLPTMCEATKLWREQPPQPAIGEELQRPLFSGSHWGNDPTNLGSNIDDRRLFQRTDDLRKVVEGILRPETKE